MFGIALGGLLGAGIAFAPEAAADPGPIVQRSASMVTADALPTVQIDGVVWDQEIIGDTVYAGGDFANARPAGAAPGTNLTPRSNLLAYNIRTGVLITSFNPVLNGKVKALAASPDGKRLYVGGSFTTVNGVNRYRIAAFDTATGALVTNFAPAPNATVSSISVTDTVVYAGGGFNKVKDAVRPGLAAFSPTNGALLGWAPSVDNGSVNAVLVSPDKSRVIVAGNFSSINGATATGLGSVDATTAALLPFAANTVVRNYGTNAAMLSLSTDGTTIYSGGYWYGGTGNFEGVLAADPNTGAIKWLADCHGDTYGASPVNGVIYTVSHHHYCSSIGGFPDTNPRSAWYRADAFTAEATGTVAHNGQGGYYDFYGQPAPSMINWYPTVPAGTFTGQSQGGWTTTGNSEYLVQGGEFPSVNGTPQQGLVRFAIPALAPKKDGPRASGADFTPSLLAVSNKSVKVKWQANWDRDDQTLSYELTRADSATPIYTTTQTNQFWNRPTMSFTDNTVVAGQTYKYRIAAIDPDGNRVQSALVSITVPATVSPYLSQVVADGASNYWRLNGTGPYADYAGSTDLTATTGVTAASGAGAIAGDTDGAASFDGSAGSAATTTAVPGPNTFTAEAWFKTTTTSGGKIVGFGNASTGNSSGYDRHVYMDNSGRLNFGVYNGTTSTLRSTATYNDGQWHQAVAQMSPAGMAFYVDGIKVGSNSVTAGQDYSGFWRVGADNLGSWPNQPSSSAFNGTIDEVSIYPTALTTAQLRDHYTKSGRTVNLPAAPSDAYGKAVYDDEPSLFWRLNESSGTTAADTSAAGVTGIYSGGYTQGTASTVTTSGTAVTFNGTNGTVASSVAFNNPSAYSEELWFKTTTTRGGKLIGFGDAQSGTSGNYDRHVYMENSGQLTFGTYTGQLNTTTSPTSYNNGQWHHLVATQGADGMKLYVDGAVVGTNAQTSAQSYSGYWRIGGDSSWSGDNFFNGSIDEAAVYPTALTAAQVKAHYQASPAAVNAAPTAAFTSSCTDGGCTFDAATSADSDGTIASYAWDFGDTKTGTGVAPEHGYTTSGTYNVSLEVTDNQGAKNTVTQPVTVTVPAVNQDPTAAFTNTCTELVCAFDATTSADPDGSIASYAWDFGDGKTSTVATPSHTFAADDTYAVKLTVTDNRGGTDTVTKNVTVKANVKPTAAFTSSCAERVCAFDGSGSTDSDGTVASYAWDFGDGDTSTLAKPSHTFATDDTYTVKLTVTDNQGATDVVTHDVSAKANAKPVASFTATCTALSCSLDASASADSDGTVASYAWDFDDDSAAGSGKTTSHAYTAGGSYDIKLTVTDNAGATDTVTKTVTVSAAANQAPTAAFTSSSSGLTASLDGSSSADADGTIDSYAWDFGDGSSGTGKSPSHTYAGTGSFSVTLKVTDDDGATKSLTKRIVVAPGVVAADAFDRTASKWGTADQGGAWTLTGSTSFSTNGSTGNIKLASAGAGATGALNGVSQQNVNVVADVNIDTMATGSGTYTTFIGRKVGTSDYRMTYQVVAGGQIRLNLTKTVNGTATSLKNVNVSGLTYSPGESIRVRFTATGSGTTALSGKVWKTGTAEPATAQITATDTTASLQAPGAFAIYAYLGGSATTFPVTVGVDNLLITPN
ncbi:MAG: PKD domain-containing protein [Propionibacteriaceae bacterium]